MRYEFRHSVEEGFGLAVATLDAPVRISTPQDLFKLMIGSQFHEPPRAVPMQPQSAPRHCRRRPPGYLLSCQLRKASITKDFFSNELCREKHPLSPRDWSLIIGWHNEAAFSRLGIGHVCSVLAVIVDPRLIESEDGFTMTDCHLNVDTVLV